MNGIWAVKCYGWMELSDKQFEAVTRDTGSLRVDLSRWAIVKEYEPALTDASHLPKIYANFEIAKRAKTLPQDIRPGNYRGTKIVDLSSVLTYPCPEWSDFWFEFFYEETIDGVLTWFPNPPPQKIALFFPLLLAGSLVLALCGSFVLRRIRR